MVGAYLPYESEAEASLTPGQLLVLKRQYEREQPRVRVQTKFNYAWGMIKSDAKSDRLQGVELMHEIYNEYPERKRECLYYLSIGYYKLGEYANARTYIEQLLAVEPNNKQAIYMRELIDEKVSHDGLIGMAMAGGVVALLGVAAAALIRRSKK